MFSIGFIELLMVAVVGLLVFGPDKLPGVVREASMWINRFKRYASEVRRDFEEQVDDLENDSALASMREGRQLLDEVQRDLNQTIAPGSPSKAVGPTGGEKS